MRLRSLLDVNVLVALFDEDHAFNERAHRWLEANLAGGWASCPLTENGLVRILTHSGYSAHLRRTVREIITALEQFRSATDHRFWPDHLSLADPAVFDLDRIHGSRQLTDLYLLGLATAQKGRLVTFDEGIVLSAVRRSTRANLCVI